MKRIIPAVLFASTLTFGGCVVEESTTDMNEGEATEAITTQAVQPFSMVIASDPQFWWSKEDMVGDAAETFNISDNQMEEWGYETNRNQVKAMNAFTAGGILPEFSKPSGVIINGDLTEYGRKTQWEAFDSEYFGKLVYPIFPGLGNHDYGDNNHNDCGAAGVDIADDTYACNHFDGAACDRLLEYSVEGTNWCGNNSRRHIEQWVDEHRSTLTAFDPDSLAYSWVKSGIRFIQLHNYPLYAEPDFQISSSIAFLHDQLADATNRGERVVLNMHEFFGGQGSPDPDESASVPSDAAIVAAMAGFEYNILGIFSGHLHGDAGFQGAVPINGIQIPWFRSGSATWNFFLHVQFNADNFKVTVMDAQSGLPVPILEEQHRFGSICSCGNVWANPKAPSTHLYPVNPCPSGLQPSSAPANGAYQCITPNVHRVVHGFTQGGAQQDDHFGYAVVSGDFNGDGKSDVAVGAPYEDLDGKNDAGAVNVVYGSVVGLSSLGNQMWDKNSPGILGDPQTDGQFGRSLAAGDFNGDGYCDLAVGAPGEVAGGQLAAGAVYVLYGSAAGLKANGSVTPNGTTAWTQDSPYVTGVPEKGDNFGWALAAGDFNGDGRDDLAIGVPNEDLPGGTDGGSVHILRGTSSGLSGLGDPGFDQDSPFVAGVVEGGDRFGWSLAAGDFNGDGKADLAIGAPYEDLPGGNDGGTVHFFRGTATGLSALGDPGFDQDSPYVQGSVEGGDKFGWALAAGDFNGDGKADLAVGVPFEDIGSSNDAGMIHIFLGTPMGPSPVSDPGFNQDSPNVQGAVQAGDEFGWALAAGDFDGDGKSDLAVGVPGEDLAGGTEGGMVNLFRGTSSGLSAVGDLGLQQDLTNVEGAVEPNDHFGWALAAGDFNGDGRADLAVGVPGENLRLGGNENDGMCNIFYGGNTGITTAFDQVWTQNQN